MTSRLAIEIAKGREYRKTRLKKILDDYSPEEVDQIKAKLKSNDRGPLSVFDFELLKEIFSESEQ